MGMFDKINKSEKKVINFMESVEDELALIKKNNEPITFTKFNGATPMVRKCEDDCRNAALRGVLTNIYTDTLPFPDVYKALNNTEIVNRFDSFIDRKCPQGLELYIREKMKKSPCAEKIMEEVEGLVNDTMSDINDKLDNGEAIAKSEVEFDPENNEFKDKVSIIGKNVTPEEIIQMVRQNVVDTAKHEIKTAIDEKNKLKDLESQLANDINIDTPAAVESALELNDINTVKDYTPSIFTGMMINKLNKISPKFESGELSNIYLHGALEEFGFPAKESTDVNFATAEDLAFMEAVEEFTALSLFRTMKFENITARDFDSIALEYAQAK